MNKLTKSLSFTKSTNLKWCFFVLSIVTVLVFANSIPNGYNYDDTLVTQNQPLTSNASLSSIRTIFTGSYYKDAMGHSFGYRPMVLLSFAIEHSLFSENAYVSHGINFLLYLICGLVFFNVLRNFLGEDKLMVAFLASLLFVVHPVHSEVVASIKNRDEILAFLFAMLTGLMAIKYLDKKAWYYLLLSGLFFAAGMLSKKSVFPLSLVLPIGLVFFKEISIRQLLLVSMSVIIPGAIIGSDFRITEFVLLLIFPLLAVAAVFLFYSTQIKKTNKNQKELLFKEYIIAVVSWVFIGWSIYQNNFAYAILAFLLLSISKLELKNSVFQMMLQLVFIGYFLKIYDCFLIAFLVSAAYVSYSVLNKKGDVLSILISVLSMLGFVYLNAVLSLMFLVVFVFLFFYVTFKNAKLGLLLSGINLIISLVYFQVGLYQIALVVFSIVVNFNFLKESFLSYMKRGIVMSVLGSMIYIGFKQDLPNYFFKSLTTSSGEVENIQEYLKKLPSKSEISEGRRLEYMENTLVAPHSTSEKIATGMVVLGEYMRLMVFPDELSFYYGYSKIKTTNFNDYKVWFYLSIYLSLIIVGIYQIKKRPIISFGILWYVLSIVLFSNWVELVAGMLGERLAFTASAGFCIFMASLVCEFKPNFNFFKPKKMEFVFFSVLLLLSARTFSRNRDWQSPVKLMSHDIEHLENSAQANNMLALSLMNESLTNPELSNETRLDYQNKAVKYFSKANSIYPYFFNYHFDLGRANVVLHNYESAKKAFVDAYKLQPENLLSLEELTKVSFDLKQKEDTVYYGNLYTNINPYNEKIQEFVAYICLLNKDFISTKKYAERGLSYFPDNENFKHMIIDSSN